jgi:hypothetical protein
VTARVAIAKDDKFIAFLNRRPAERLFIEVTRVAKDGTWADLVVCTWGVMWRKRQKLKDGMPPDSTRKWWDGDDLMEQESDWMAKRAEERSR